MTETRSTETIKKAHEWNDRSIMLQHQYENAQFKMVDGVLRVFDKHDIMMPMVSSQRKVKNRAW